MAQYSPETERVRRIYDRRAGNARPSSSNRASLRWLCSRARGDTLEVGIGTGQTLPYYSRTVRLTGLEPSQASLDRAAERAHELRLDSALVAGDAAALPFADEHFDTVVFAYALCTIPDDRAAVAEAVRVLRPGGLLLLVEHVRSPNPLVRTLERVFDPIEVRRVGDHLVREPLDHVLAEGLKVEELERRMLGIEERLSARKPDAERMAQAG
jgi:ubiquinone/menaquinone biosynthesis C-methylase UbiE